MTDTDVLLDYWMDRRHAYEQTLRRGTPHAAGIRELVRCINGRIDRLLRLQKSDNSS